MPHWTKYPTLAKLPPPTTSSVVTVTALLAAETLSNVSRALTVNVYAVKGDSPVTVAVVPVTEVARVPPRNTSYPAMPFASVEAFHANETLDEVLPVERRFPGTVGGVVSLPGSSVLVVTGALAADTLPWLSFALTVNVYDVFGVSPDTVAAVPVTEWASVAPWYTSCPAIGKSVAPAAVHMRLIVLVVRAVTARPAGVPGGRDALPSHLFPLMRQLVGAVPEPMATNEKLYGSVSRPGATVPL